MKKQYNRTTYAEGETRKRLITYAKLVGAEGDLKRLFEKWDMILRTIPPQEKVEASRLAILEVQSLLDIHAEEGDGLAINGEVVIPNAKIKNPKMTW